MNIKRLEKYKKIRNRIEKNIHSWQDKLELINTIIFKILVNDRKNS